METVRGIVSITANTKRSACVDGRLNAELMKFLQTNEIILAFKDNEFILRKPTIDDRKTYKVQPKGTFSFECALVREQIIGTYEAIDYGDGEDELVLTLVTE